MADIKGKVFAFLEGKEKEYFKELIKKEATKSGLEVFLRKKIGDDYVDEILSVLYLKLYLLKEELETRPRINHSYISRVIYTCMVDTLNGNSEEKVVFRDEEGEVRDFEEVFGEEEDYELSPASEELFGAVSNKLKDKDIDVLCYYLYKELYSVEIKLEGMNKTTLYKRWERLKKKLAKLFPFKPTEEEFREFAEKYLSEVCEKRGYKRKEEN
ncbi:hypothetical protein JCM9492_10750 [Aquifex pyrophilus]